MDTQEAFEVTDELLRKHEGHSEKLQEARRELNRFRKNTLPTLDDVYKLADRLVTERYNVIKRLADANQQGYVASDEEAWNAKDIYGIIEELEEAVYS